MRSSLFITSATLAMTLGLAAGCSDNPVFVDDEGTDHEPLAKHDELSLPYATGTRVTLVVSSGGPKATWTIVSDAPSIFALEDRTFDNGELHVVGYAASEGSTIIRLMDGSSELHRATVTVKTANQARLYGHGQVRLGGRDEAALAAAQVTSAAIVTGGKGAFAVAYFRDQERLYGRKLLDAPTVTGLAVTMEQTASVATNEWLFVVPAAEGTYELPLEQNGTTLATLPITAVAPTSITALSLVEESGTHARGDEVWVLLKAQDAAGHDVLGVYADWTLAGVAQTASDKQAKRGDLYRYSKSSANNLLSATAGGLSATRTVPADNGSVYDTTYLGCSASGSPAVGFGSALLVFAALLLARRIRFA